VKPTPDTRLHTAALVGVLLVAAVLRIWGLDHGLPHNLVPDTTSVRAALSLGAGDNPFSGDLLPTQYPYFFPYVLFGVYGSMYLGGAAAGYFPDVSAFGEFAFRRPDVFFLIARSVVAGFGVAMVLLVFACGRRIADNATGLVAAAFTATSLLLVQLSHQARPHIVGTTAVLLCLWLGLRYLAQSRSIDLIAAWVVAAVAGSTVPYGFMGVVIPLALTIRVGGDRRRPLLAGSIGLLLFVGIVLLCFPSLILGPTESFAHDPHTGVIRYFGGLEMRPGLINGMGFLLLARWLVLSEPILAAIWIPAVALILLQPGERKKWWLTALFPALFALVYGSYEVIHPRYLVPLIPFLSLVSGWLVARWVSRAAQRGSESVTVARRLGVVSLLAVVFALPTAQAVRLDCLLARVDTRLLAERWIELHIPATELLAVESHGVPIAPDRSSLELMARAFPDRLGVRDRYRLATVADGDGRAVCRLWHHASREHLSIAELTEVHDVRFVAATVLCDTPRKDRFYTSLKSAGTLVKCFSPLVTDRATTRCRLPLELDNPLLGLWQVERCGPTIEIFELADG